MRAVKQFFDWCDERHLKLTDIEAIIVATYIEKLETQASKPTVKQPLAAIRQLLDYLTTGDILDVNQAGFGARTQIRSQTRQDPSAIVRGSAQLLDSIAIPLSATTTSANFRCGHTWTPAEAAPMAFYLGIIPAEGSLLL
jgi:hypothetical protein